MKYIKRYFDRLFSNANYCTLDCPNCWGYSLYDNNYQPKSMHGHNEQNENNNSRNGFILNFVRKHIG